jgi:hypothetical protein
VLVGVRPGSQAVLDFDQFVTEAAATLAPAESKNGPQ